MCDKICVIPGCGRHTSSRGSKTCGPEHALLNRKMAFHSSTDNLPEVGSDGRRECAFENCHNRFHPLRKNQKYCPEDHYVYCQNPDCGRRFKISKSKLGKPPIACCASCATKLGHTKESKQRRRENSLKRWGTEDPLQAEEVKAKIKETLDSDPSKDYRIGTRNHSEAIKRKYGEEITNVSQLDVVKRKKAESNRRSRGVDNPMKADDIKDKVRNTNLLKYGVPTALNLPENKKKAVLGTSIYANSVSNGSNNIVSKVNKEFSDLLKRELDGIDVRYEEAMPCKTSRIDLKVTNLGNGRTVLVDINPTISHNSLKSFQCAMAKCDSSTMPCPHGHHPPVSKNYSMDRALEISTDLPNTKYIQVWDWDNKDGIVNLIRRELRAPGDLIDAESQDLHCRIIDTDLARSMLENWTGSALDHFRKLEETYYGVYLDGVLLAVSAFQKLHDDVWAMYNTGFRPDVRGRGLQTSIYEEFKSQRDPSKTFLFIDMSKNTKPMNPMRSVGFEPYKITGPTPVWFNTKSKEAQVDLHESEDKDIMIGNGFTLIYTPGFRVFKAE